jgi:hypothetical protein
VTAARVRRGRQAALLATLDHRLVRGDPQPGGRQYLTCEIGSQIAKWLGGTSGKNTLMPKQDRRDRRTRRDLHAVDANGMVACNPRDREAAHRAEVEGIATSDPAAVTCRKCLAILHRGPRGDGA